MEICFCLHPTIKLTYYEKDNITYYTIGCMLNRV
jgi:hypothetical protein